MAIQRDTIGLNTAVLALPVLSSWELMWQLFHLSTYPYADQCLRPYPDENVRHSAKVGLGIENFSMCRREASYVAHLNWQLGFSVIHLESFSGRFQWHPIAIGGRGFVWYGREYRL